MTMKPEDFVDDLKTGLADKLKSVVLYGSAATGDFLKGVSGYNLLVVAEPLETSELQAVHTAAVKWEKSGNPLPQFFTPAELAGSADAFPIEILDMQRSRKVLFGTDLLAGLKVDPAHLRMQLEHELKSKLLFFRQRYLVACHTPERLTSLLASSVSTFLVLFRASLELYDEEVPSCKQDALKKLAAYISFDSSPFESVLELKSSHKLPAGIDLQTLAANYLAAIERIVQAVDQHLHPKS